MIQKLLLPLVFFVGYTGLFGQVIINEISYNPPESGTDSLEYIELYNAGNSVVNIGGWHFLAGIVDTFPAVDLQPGDYYVTTFNAQAMLNVYGISVHQWTSGGLNNSGELISLADSDGAVVDSVRFLDKDPWPTEADGNGPSLELKDPSLDNADAANWQICGANTGVIINGFEVKGTPGAQNSGGGTAGPAVTIAIANFKFNPKEVVVAIGETVRWVNAEAIGHNVNGTQATYPNNPESFTSGAPAPGLWQYDYIPLTAGLYDYRCDPHFSSGMVGTVSVYDPLSYTDFALPRLRLTNENGSALYDGVPTTVTGVVHGVNYQPTGYSFYVIDANNVGINVFSFDPGSYVVTQGDRVKVSGVIDQFNGLLEIIPDTVELLSTGNAINSPRNIIEIKEEDEGSYLYTTALVVDSVSNISATGYTIYTTHEEGASISVRVDADANIPFGPEEFSQGAIIQVEGIGTQFDNSFPFTSGYQLLAMLVGPLEGIQLLDIAAIRMVPNPAFESIHLSSDLLLKYIDIYSLDGRHEAGQVVNSTETEIAISNLPVGLHIVKAVTDQGIWTSRLSVIR